MRGRNFTFADISECRDNGGNRDRRELFDRLARREETFIKVMGSARTWHLLFLHLLGDFLDGRGEAREVDGTTVSLRDADFNDGRQQLDVFDRGLRRKHVRNKA